MVPFVSRHGFTADVRSCTITVRPRRRGRWATILPAVAVPLVFVSVLLSTLGRTDADADSSVEAPQSPYYDFRIYALNCTAQNPTANGTLFKFNAADLPFEFSTLSFGDHRADDTFLHKYYGGSGIIVQATGASAVMTLREGGGRFVCTIDYHGQTQVVFNGKAESVTYPSNSTTYDGTDRIVQDWRMGMWRPSDGVLVEHPSNITLANAKFYMMTLEPSGTLNLPEFDPLLMVGMIGALFIALRTHVRRKRSREA